MRSITLARVECNVRSDNPALTPVSRNYRSLTDPQMITLSSASSSNNGSITGVAVPLDLGIDHESVITHFTRIIRPSIIYGHLF